MKQYLPGIVGVGLIVSSIVVLAAMGIVIMDTIVAMEGYMP